MTSKSRCVWTGCSTVPLLVGVPASGWSTVLGPWCALSMASRHSASPPVPPLLRLVHAPPPLRAPAMRLPAPAQLPLTQHFALVIVRLVHVRGLGVGKNILVGHKRAHERPIVHEIGPGQHALAAGPDVAHELGQAFGP